MINNFIAYYGATYIRGLTVSTQFTPFFVGQHCCNRYWSTSAISFRVPSLAPGQSNDCTSASESTLRNNGKNNKNPQGIHNITTRKQSTIKPCVFFLIKYYVPDKHTSPHHPINTPPSIHPFQHRYTHKLVAQLLFLANFKRVSNKNSTKMHFCVGKKWAPINAIKKCDI